MPRGTQRAWSHCLLALCSLTALLYARCDTLQSRNAPPRDDILNAAPSHCCQTWVGALSGAALATPTSGISLWSQICSLGCFAWCQAECVTRVPSRHARVNGQAEQRQQAVEVCAGGIHLRVRPGPRRAAWFLPRSVGSRFTRGWQSRPDALGTCCTHGFLPQSQGRAGFL